MVVDIYDVKVKEREYSIIATNEEEAIKIFLDAIQSGRIELKIDVCYITSATDFKD